ncbi:MAG TPA: GH3 auxin-responsive promoter family protein [Phycisphaerae bacterium]|nr:GH3 auxin-responsive promoter family protein [Phycisphaerae bacterium]
MARTLLRPVAYAAGLHASGQLRAFLSAHERTAAVQQRLLSELIAAHEQTDFGRDHGFGRIRTYGDFTSAVPIRSYEALRPYVERVLDGHDAALLPPDDRALMFSMTSGTTGRPKHIPVTRRFLRGLRRGWNVWGLRSLRDHPEAWLRSILQISSSMRESSSPSGVPCGAVSGLLAVTQKRIVRRMYVVPPAVADIHDPAVKYYTILRCGVGRDVSIITTANPSSTIKLIETGQQHADRLVQDVAAGTYRPPGEAPADLAKALRFKPRPALAARLRDGIRRDGQLMPGHFWRPAFLANWTGGTLKLYLPRLRALFGDVPVRDVGLLASEGRFSVPLADHTPAGVAEITANFLEFIPAEQRDSERPDALRAHELDVGHEYFLVFSNWTGLWRYDLDDRVRVVDRLGRSPVFEFLSRGLHTASITGEKISEHQVVEAMRLAAAAAGVTVERFCVQGRFAATPYYELRLDAEQSAAAHALAGGVDRELGELNMEYRSKRDSGRLGPIRPVLLAAGAMEQAEARNILRRRGRGEQYKHQYLLTDVIGE